MFKIVLENKTNKDVYYNIKNFSIDEKQKLKKIKSGEAKTDFADSTIANLYIYSDKKSLLWDGTTPTNVSLEIFEENCKLNVYLDNNKLPAFAIEDLECKINPANCRSRTPYFIILSIIIFIIILFLIKKYKY